MNVALDQTGASQTAFGIVDPRVAGSSGRDRDDATVFDADIYRLTVARTLGKPRIADNEIHEFSLL